MKTKLNRRQVLRGTGALITLPALESLGFRRFASAAPAGPPPKRMIFLGIGYGVTSETWFPNINDKGAGYKLPVGLKPLARHKKDFTIVQGRQSRSSRMLSILDRVSGCQNPQMMNTIINGFRRIG